MVESEVREALGSLLASVHFTALQKAILFALGDGEPHLIGDLLKVVDSECTRVNLSNHVSRIRDKINPLGHEILCQCIKRRLYYRYVLLLNSLII